MNTKHCVIIGSGLGGLVTGLILSRFGYKVTILEKHFQAGGCLQCFTRRGVKFETGMHYIGSVDPGQTMHRLLRWLELDALELSRLDTQRYDIISLGGNRFDFANGHENFIDTMGNYFPAEKDNLARYLEIIDEIGQASSLQSLKRADSSAILQAPYQKVSVSQVMDSLFDDPMIRNVLVGNLPLYAGEKDRTPFAQHAFVTDFYNKSAFRPIGGSDNITRLLLKALDRYGAEVVTRTEVKSIVCDDCQTTGVITTDERYIPADFVIADIHPARLIEMLDTKLIRPVYRKRIQDIRNTAAPFTAYIVFKQDTVPYLNSNFFSYKGMSPWGCEEYTPESWPKGYLYMQFCDKENQKFARGAQIISYMNMSELQQWENTRTGHRGPEYEDFKKHKAEILIDALDKDFPGIKRNIEAIYTSTPLTYRDYTGTEGGAMYGVAPDITAGPSGRVHHRTRIPNLFLCGQNINSHGILGVIVQCIVTASELIPIQNIYQQIKSMNHE